MSLFQQINNLFPQYPISHERTLMECEFYDTHRRYYDEIDDQYLNATNMSPDDLVIKYDFGFLPDRYKNIALHAARTRSRPNEGIRTWKDVDYEYLYLFGQNYVFLEPEGFKFFLPATIYNYLSNPNKNDIFIDSFVFRFSYSWSKDGALFNKDQKDFIAKFLNEHFKVQIGWVALD